MTALNIFNCVLPESTNQHQEFQRVVKYYLNYFIKMQFIISLMCSFRNSCWRSSVCSETWWSSASFLETGTSCVFWPASENRPLLHMLVTLYESLFSFLVFFSRWHICSINAFVFYNVAVCWCYKIYHGTVFNEIN